MLHFQDNLRTFLMKRALSSHFMASLYPNQPCSQLKWLSLRMPAAKPDRKTTSEGYCILCQTSHLCFWLWSSPGMHSSAAVCTQTTIVYCKRQSISTTSPSQSVCFYRKHVKLWKQIEFCFPFPGSFNLPNAPFSLPNTACMGPGQFPWVNEEQNKETKPKMKRTQAFA